MTNPAALDPFIDAADLTPSVDDQILYATARIRDYCRWHIYPVIASTVTVDTTGGALLVLPTLQLTSVDSVSLNVWGYADGGATVTEVDLATVQYNVAGVLSRPGCGWPYGSVTVQFGHGYNTVPDGLRGVAVAVAKRIPTQMVGVSSEMAGGVSRTFGASMSGGFAAAGFTLDEQAVLDAYRLPPRP